MKNYNKRLNLFLSSQAISLFGSALVQYAIIWYITLTTKSGLMMMLATICSLVPQVVISLFAGVWADNYNKKTLIIIADSMIAFVTLIIASLFLLGINDIWLLFAVLGIRSLGSGIQSPCVTAFIPEITPADKLMKANSINTTIQSLMMIVAPAISGLLLANVELEYILFVDIITAAIGIGIFALIKVKYTKKKQERIEYLKAIKEGLVYVKESSFLSRAMVYLGTFNLLITPLAILTPLMVTRLFGDQPLYLTLNEILFFIGNVLGGIILSSWGGFKNKIKTVGLAGLISGIFTVLIGFSFNLVYYLSFMALLGMTMPFMNTPFITLFQEKVEAEKQGRVFSLVTLLASSVMPLGMLVYGPLADLFKIQYLIIVTGILFLLVSVYLLKDKIVKNALGF